MKIEKDIVDANTKEIIFKKGIRVTPRILKDFEKNNTDRYYITTEDDIKRKFLAKDIVNLTTGEVLYESTQEVTQEIIDSVKALNINEIVIIDVNNVDSGSFIRDTIVLDKNKDEEQALADIYKVLRPGEPSTPEVAKQLFESMFFDNEKYDLSAVGRMKINKKHDLDVPHTTTALTKDDIIVIIKHLLNLKCGIGTVDDIDSLANRRVRSVGELVENQFRMGLVRMQKSIVDRMSSVEIDNVMPHDLVNSKTLMSYLREFFGISQLSQFMDQTNPLAEITHKRRLSALGPGGLTRERAGFEGTCINQRPIVKVGQYVEAGDILADGASTDMGELALGKNILVAFMPWNGYNFEDSILLSERLVKDDIYTSVHINEYEIVARDTRLGPEEITRDIPNVNEENLTHLDETGIVNIGAQVKPGDILVGKVTPKTESPLTPEEKLLRAIFGEKAADVRNSSLRVPPGEKGVIVDVKIFTKRGVQKDERAISIERNEIEKFSKDMEDEKRIIEDYVFNKVKVILFGKKVKDKSNKSITIDQNFLDDLDNKQVWSLELDDKKSKEDIQKLEEFYDNYLKKLEKDYKHKVEKLQSGDDLPQGVLKIIKIYVANKLKIQPGDKMA
ncbi:hypothetical protein TRIADDRAFT_62839, partial [Trichoplax adhaerens]